MSVVYGAINKVLSEITIDISNNNGKHNNFVVITDSEKHYIGKTDPVILRYDKNIGEWVFVADKTIVNFGYLTEVINVTDNDVLLHKEPLDKVIWDVYILDEDKNIIKTVNSKELFVEGNFLSGLEPYIGQTLSLMYAFGDKEDDGEIVRVDLPVETGYQNQVVDDMLYDGPYDMNDILSGVVYPPAKSSFDRVILERIKELDSIVSRYNSRRLYTTEKILIEDNKINLPYLNIGTVVHDMAIIYMSSSIDDKLIMMEVTCNTDNKGVVYFDSTDELNGYYAVVTYLAELDTPLT